MAFFLTQNIAQNIGNAIMTSQHITPATKKMESNCCIVLRIYNATGLNELNVMIGKSVMIIGKIVNQITTAKPSICEGIPCDHGDGFYPEGDCAQCFCRCVGGAHYETCCAPGLAFNPAVEQCDWPANINGCQ